MLFRVVRGSKKNLPDGQVAVLGTLGVTLPPGDARLSFQCFTLERQSVIIPVYLYDLELTKSSRAEAGSLWTPFDDPTNPLHALEQYRHFLPEVLRVPGRTGIRVHALNEAEQSDGCIGVGKTHTDSTIAQARDALTTVCTLMVEARARMEGCQIDVVERYLSVPTWALP